jgi:membrane protease YdiL (CAAX protease family)
LLALLPAFIIIRIVFKDKLTDYGFQLGDWKLGLKLTVVFSLFMIILLWIVTASEDFIEKYPLLNSTKYSFQTFIIYQVLTFIYLTGWEFTWRGFMLFGLEKKFGYYAVVIQMIPFTLLHFGKPFLETLSSIPGGIALGVLALRTRSFYYCLLVHFSVMFAIDTISILRFHSNEFAIGINSFINLIKTILGY